VDLNLLRTFVAIYEAGSLTGAAARLHVTQSAVSQSLTRLRRDVADDVFLRVGRGIAPTPFAVDLYPAIRAALDEIESAVDVERDFDPLTSRRRFRIALSELGHTWWLPPIYATLTRAAPDITLDVVQLDPTRTAEQLTRGLLDVVLNSAPVPGLTGDPVSWERYVVLRGVRPGGEVWDLAAYLAARHVLVTGDSGRPALTAELDRMGVVPRPHLVVQHYAALPSLLAVSDLVATIPESVAREWARTWPLEILPLPLSLEPVPVRLYTRSAHGDAASLQWFRALILEAVGSAEYLPLLNAERVEDYLTRP